MLQLADDDVDGDQIKTPFGNDEVRVSLGGFHKLEMHRPDDVHVLRHHGLDRTAPLARVPQEAADEPDVSVRVDVELDVQQVAQRRVLPVSYTHLRAHETRHDLVCRLLLEKKKK